MEHGGQLGRNIRARRVRLGLSLEALAERSGVSRAMLSEIERDAKNPTVRVACQIAEGLGCPLSELLDEEGANGEQTDVRRGAGIETVADVVRYGAWQTLVDPLTGAERRLLAPTWVRRGVEVIWYVIPGGKGTGPCPPHQPGVVEHITVMQGALRFLLAGEEVALETGDSVSFRADLSHEFTNPGAEPCHYLLIIDSSHVVSSQHNTR